MAIPFDLNDLLAFRAVAELGSFRQAAESIHLSQPALSRRIEKLEQALGVRLFERSTRRVSLTAVGREVERQVRDLLGSVDSLLLGLRGASPIGVREVTLACVPSTVNYHVSAVLHRFRERCPGVRVKLLDSHANAGLDAVVRGEADFGINFLGAQEREIEFQTLHEERFVAACRRDHPLARLRRVSWAQLAEHEYVAVSRQSGNRLLLDQALAGVGRRPQAILESLHVTSTLGLVEAGLGVAAVPAMAMPGPGHPLLCSVPLVDPVITRRIGLIRRRGRDLSSTARQLFDLFVSMRGRRQPPGTAVPVAAGAGVAAVAASVHARSRPLC